MENRLCEPPKEGEQDVFFPEQDEKPLAAVRKAKALCNAGHFGGPCPVRTECYNYAMRDRIEYGVWGGRSAAERIKAWPAWQAANPSQADLMFKDKVKDSALVEKYRELAEQALDILTTNPPREVKNFKEIMRVLELVRDRPDLTREAQAKVLGTYRTRVIEMWGDGLALAGVSSPHKHAKNRVTRKAGPRKQR